MTEKPPKHHLALIPPASRMLNQKSASVPIEEITTQENRWVIEEMLAIAHGTQGDTKKPTMVGLAAPQLGVNKRIIIVDVAGTGMGEKPELRVYVNPVITHSSASREEGREGCFSTGNVCGIVSRASDVTVEAYDRNGKQVKEKHSGFTAHIIQHEIDHLDGIRFPDKITDDKKLHWVEPDRFGEYREHWRDWDSLCGRGIWASIKSGATEFLPEGLSRQ